MDAGVPISDPVAGVAMGLIKEGDNFIVLTDILGDEDALGDMDFKIAGTAEGVTAVQMDIKITGLTTEIMRKAMRQAHEARLHILGEMKKAIDGPRAELSKYAPQHAEVFVNPEVIRMIIGPGGKNIKAITAATGASVDIEDSGRISIFAPTAESMEQAKELVQYYDQRPDLGKNYMGKVRKVLEIGAIVEIMPNVEALVHISQLDTSRVAQASDVAHLGEDMLVRSSKSTATASVPAARPSSSKNRASNGSPRTPPAPPALRAAKATAIIAVTVGIAANAANAVPAATNATN